MPDDTPNPGHVHTLTQLAQRQPMVAVLAMVLVGGGGGTLGATYIAPLVDDALSKHEANDRAHDVDRIEERLDRIEASLTEQKKTTDETKSGIDRALLILESR